MNKPLSNEEIEQAIGPCVILYSDLEKYPTIQNLLPRNGDYVVILVRERKNSAHWVCSTEKGYIINFISILTDTSGMHK